MQTEPVPEKTSSLAFEHYAASPPTASSVPHRWPHVIVRTFADPAVVENVVVPAVPDPHLVLILTGSLRLEQRLRGASTWEPLLVHAGQLFLTPRGEEAYELRWTTQEPTTSVHIHLDQNLLDSAALELADLDPARLEVLERNAVQDPLLAELCRALARALHRPDPAGPLYVESVARLLAVHLLREHTNRRPAVKTTYKGGLPPYRLRQVLDYIQANLAHDLALPDLAAVAQLSPYHFARQFKQATGESPFRFVIRRRMEEAMRLLRETDFGVTHVAFAVGYHSTSQFFEAFRRHAGATPQQYRSAR